MEIPEVVSNPLFFSILEGLRTEYSVFDHLQVQRRRSRSHSPHGSSSVLFYDLFFYDFFAICSIFLNILVV